MKIIVSACLLGDNVKYNGGNNYFPKLKEFLKNDEVFKVCPEVMGGLSIPRVPAEIKNDKVYNKEGLDVTDKYLEGARKTLGLALENDIHIAILKEKSPSCGSNEIYDGTFLQQKINGMGITAKLLKENNIIVLNEINYEEYLKKNPS